MPLALELIYLTAIAHVWARGSIFRPFREKIFPALFDCPLCSGFWIGFIGHAIVRRTEWPWPTAQAITWLGIASIVGTLSLATYGLVRRI